MPVFDLFAEILPQIEQEYKARCRMRQPIRVILPIPSGLFEDSREPLDAVYARLARVPWIEAAGPFTETAIKDAAGSTVFDLSGGDFVAIDVTCKPFRDVHLA